MKKILLLLATTGGLLVGCSGKPELPQACLDLVDTLSEIAKMDPSGEAMAQMPDPKEMIAELEKKWETMTDAEKEKSKKDCEQVKGVMDMLKSMGNLGN